MPLNIHLNQIPSVDKVLKHQDFAQLIEDYGRDAVLGEVRHQLATARKNPSATEPPDLSKPVASASNVIEQLHTAVQTSLVQDFAPSLRKVFNLTGTILHTNLGRAPYPQSAIDAMVQVSRGACNLEYNLEKGQRGRRDDHIEKWICKLTGAEAATTVNNNAAAVLLTLNTLANKKNVIVSRGELIEIGGSFRIPAIMKKAGCKLREVGTTNRTHLSDYAENVGKKTAAIMKVHTSNYEIKGFSKSVAPDDLADLAKQHNIVLIDDLGSGTLIDPEQFGLPTERTVEQALQDGADVVTFSGDKLLGGPQCGIIAGRRDLVNLIDKNPMKRAMRLDKVTIAALEAVLKLYSNPQQLTDAIPALQLLTQNIETVTDKANHLQSVLAPLFPSARVVTRAADSQIGSGALPTKIIPSYAVTITPPPDTNVADLAKSLRSLSVPVIGRIAKDALWLDCRGINHEFEALCEMLRCELSERLH